MSFEEICKKIKRESDGSSPGHDRQLYHEMGGGSIRRVEKKMLGGVVGINSITPCAACKLLRRRCAQECPFSPYFSPHEPHQFAFVHKVFGASNVSKMLMEVPESQRVDAANSLVYEANVRLRDPVYGCMGAIPALQQQVELLEAELNCVRAEILKYNNNNNSYRDTNINLPTSPSSSSHITLISSGPVSITMPPPPTLHTPVTSTTADFSIDISTNENNINYFV